MVVPYDQGGLVRLPEVKEYVTGSVDKNQRKRLIAKTVTTVHMRPAAAATVTEKGQISSGTDKDRTTTGLRASFLPSAALASSL